MQATAPPPVEAPAAVRAPEPAKANEPEPEEANAAAEASAAAVASEPVVTAEPSKELEVEARLLERPGAPACGVIHAVVVMRYEVVRVVAGEYPNREIFVAHSCPEMGSTRCKELPGERIKKFRVGDVHHLRGAQRRGDGALFDEFKKQDSSPRYRASCANVVTAAP